MTEFEIIRHQVRKNRERFIRRLERNIKRAGDCHVWTGKGYKGGYPSINFMLPGRKHVSLYVHRMFLIMRLGRSIADGMEAGHFKCNNPKCVEHVREETRHDNMKDCNGRRWRKKGRCS